LRQWNFILSNRDYRSMSCRNGIILWYFAVHLTANNQKKQSA
jgi:hypothetical protein